MATLKFDELNMLWFNKMELSTAEKLLRIEMAAVFERELNKIFSSQRERADSDKYLLYATVYATIMSSTYIEITNNYFLKYVLNIASNVKGLSEYSQKWIVKHSEQFAKEIQQTTQRLIESGDYDNAFSVSRARTISRTEINALCECATLEGYYQSGYTKKMWVSFKDNKVRDTHKVADGQVRSLFEPFDIGNSQLMFPQDSSLGASAKEIVNCRCVMQPVK